MSEYAQTQRRFEKLKQTFDRLIEENSYKKLREENEKLRKDRREMFHKINGLENIIDAQTRVTASLENTIKELSDKEDTKQIREEDRTSTQES